MNIKKKVSATLLSTALGAALIGGGSYAVFTDTASNTNNTFTAGTLDINLLNESFYSGTIGNLAPGDTGYQTFEVVNNGNLELRYDIVQTLSNGPSTLVQGNTDKDLNFKVEYKTSATGAYITVLPGDNNITLGTEKIHYYRVTYSLPKDADNGYQGKSSDYKLTFNAEQTKNN